MNWEALGAVSNLLAAVAVIVTLIYVAIQIRLNTSAIRSTATQSAHDESAAVYDLLASDSNLGDLFVRGLESPETLSPGETARFFAFWTATMFRVQNWHVQTQAGLIDEELLAGWMRILKQVSGMPGYQRYWAERRSVFSRDFTHYFEQEVLSSDRDPDFRPLGVRPGDQAR